jgi:glycosyltransferase involved in cell wall biosynthesis
METGGIESHLLEFCKQMKTKDISIDLLVLNSVALKETEDAYKEVCRNVYFGKKEKLSLRLLWFIIIGLKLRFKKYTALYTNGQGDSIGLLAKLLNIKGTWVHHHHTSGDKEDQVNWTDSYIASLKKANIVIACSKRNAADMEKALLRTIETIPCFSRKISVDPYIICKAQKIRFGYYGRLIPEKGIDILCKMSGDEDLSQFEFHIWGEGVAYPASFFKNFPNINFHGAFSGIDGLIKTISSIDAFLLLSVHPEGLPICLLEAMSAGLPWLATNRGGIPDIACDPISTRVIPVTANYSMMKQELISFGKDISSGKITKQQQQKLYNDKFSGTALSKQWKFALGLTEVLN